MTEQTTTARLRDAMSECSETKPIPFTCATCGGDMQMIVTARTDLGSEGLTHCPRCDDAMPPEDV